jgi:spore protease
MGIPVIAVGVPTVVDALTLAFDLLDTEDERQSVELSESISPQGRTMVVTPKEIDLLIKRASGLISLSINMALQTDIDTEDLLDLL